MKKYWFILFVLIVFLGACNSESKTTENSIENGQTTETSEQTNSEEEEEYVLKLAHGYPTEAFHHTHMEWFAEEVKKRSDGRLTIDIFPNAQLMPADQEVPAILQGQIDMSHSTSPQLTSFDPIWNVYELPFIFDYDPEDPSYYLDLRDEFNDSENGGQKIAQKMEEKGIKILAYAYTGTFGSVFTNEKDKLITDPASAEDLNIRSPGGIITPETIKGMGANSVTLAGTEVVTGLQQNLVDGLLTSAQYAADAKLPIKTFTVAPLFNPLTPVVISLEKFESLPSDLQDVLVETGQDLEKYVNEVVTEGELAAFEKLENEMNVEFYYPTDQEIEEWREVTKPSLEKFKNEVEGGAELLEELENFQ
ncbi:TRAP transporter substrate-binding protein [Salinibacillus xinjiangensis]|uniref:TRAP transporter substrate-binding protein n=1 Tax=Salinibacillus xinjiangensis TaxID=1229268 RepID=A0A6G1X1U6_9BACI|nr:TRAP transporter substrate-binding protein [Salinibacillus xinjiangensis]MRG84870.1 hypothetical protein [Salinibacillus xinjiangensis]